MPRRNATQKDQPVDAEATATEVTPEDTDTNTTASTDSAAATGEAEAPAAESGTDNKTDGDKTDDKPATEVDLTAFKAAVEESLGEGDPDIGTLPVIAKERVAQAFRALPNIKSKNKAKEFLDDGVKKSVIGRNLGHARSYTEMRDAVNEAGSSKAAAKEPVDPKAAYVNRLAGLQLAVTLVGSNVPEGVEAEAAHNEASTLVESLGEQVTAYRDWTNLVPAEGETKPDAPEVSPVVKAAFKLAAGKAAGSTGGGSKVGGSTGGPRRDVGKHIGEAFANVEPGGFLKISEIAKFDSEEYGNGADHPSQGAVSARLFPQSGKCTVEGIEPVAGDKDKNEARGARKVA